MCSDGFEAPHTVQAITILIREAYIEIRTTYKQSDECLKRVIKRMQIERLSCNKPRVDWSNNTSLNDDSVSMFLR